MSGQTEVGTGQVATVMAIYEAFGRGDVPAILEQMADDVKWDQGIRDTGLPWLVQGEGPAHVARFFEALGGGMTFTRFEPTAVCTSDDGRTVMVSIVEGATNLATGKAVEEDVFVHIWTFGDDGKITAFRHVGDWERQAAAAR